MKMTMVTLFQICFSIFALCIIVHILARWRVRYVMADQEKKFFAHGMIPSGASLCHGMTFKEGERGLHREQQPSLNWYERISKAS